MIKGVSRFRQQRTPPCVRVGGEVAVGWLARAGALASLRLLQRLAHTMKREADEGSAVLLAYAATTSTKILSNQGHS